MRTKKTLRLLALHPSTLHWRALNVAVAVQSHPPPSFNQRCLFRRVRALTQVSECGVLWASEPSASRCYGGLEVPSTPGLEVRRFGHGERRRQAREEVTVVLAIGQTLRAHEALSRPDALPGFLEVVNRLFENGVFVGRE